MNHTYIVPIVLSSFSIFGVVIAVDLLFFRKILMGRIVGAMFLSASVATFAYVIQITSINLGDHFLWVLLRYLTLMIFAFTLTLFVFDYTGVAIRFHSWKFLGLASVPFMALFILAVNPNSPHVYSQIGSVPLGEIFKADWIIVLLYVLMQAYVMGMLFALIVLLLRNIDQKTKLNRINSIWIASGVALYMLTQLLQLGGVRLLGMYSLNMFTYFPTALLALWAIQRYRLAEIRPIAYNTIFNQMQDAILVIDHRGYLVDYNPAAEKNLSLSKRLSLGGLFDPKELDWGEFTTLADMGQGKRLQTEVKGTPYQIVTSNLVDNRGELLGYLVAVRDISSQVEVERLHEAEIVRKGAWKERVALARALHDSTLQNIGSLIMLCGSVKDSLSSQQSNNRLGLLENLETGARLAYDDLRSLINELQISENPTSEFNLWDALSTKVYFLNQQSETKIKFEIPEELPIDSQQQRELFYLVMEATNNALKHAGAKSIFIHIQNESGKIITEIHDNGHGFNVQKTNNKGMGLENMRSRALLLNGRLSIESQPSKGTTIRVVFPPSSGIHS